MYVVFSFALEPITGFISMISHGNIAREVANAHTLIKLVEVLLLFPFIKQIVKLTGFVVRDEEKVSPQEFQLQYIGAKSVFSPATAVFEATREMERMGKIAIENLRHSMDALFTMNDREIQEVYETEDQINFLNHAITDYLVKVNQTTIPTEDKKSIGGLFHVVNDIERIGDHAENFAEAAQDRMENHIPFRETAIRPLREMAEMVTEVLDYALQMFSERSTEHMKEVLQLEEAVDQLERKLQKAHVKRLTKGKCTPEASMLYSDAISGLERAADHATNIAFAILEPEDLSEEEEE